jgi:hypothetical protein
MASHDYAFVTRWRVEGTREEVFDILDRPTDLPRWWGTVYLSVQTVAEGDGRGVGRTVELYTRGWLPYTLRWRLEVSDVERPAGFGFSASGDFDGTGRWVFTQDGDHVDIHFDWRVRAEKPLLRYASFLLKPLFAANHRWAMARGEEGLKAELARRRVRSFRGVS